MMNPRILADTELEGRISELEERRSDADTYDLPPCLNGQLNQLYAERLSRVEIRQYLIEICWC